MLGGPDPPGNPRGGALRSGHDVRRPAALDALLDCVAPGPPSVPRPSYEEPDCVRAAWIVGGVAALIVVALVIAWNLSADRMVAAAIEYYGTEMLGTPVTVDSVTIRAGRGKGTIEGLRVAQPSGYGSGAAISVREMTLEIDTASLVSGDPYVVSRIHVGQPEVNFVIDAERRSNLQVLQENVARYASAQESDAAEPDESEPAAEARLRIGRLEVEKGVVSADLSAVGLGRAGAVLRSFRADDVGGASGAPPSSVASELGSRFLAHVVTSIAESTVGKHIEKLLDEGSRGVRRLLDSLFPR